jgi:hypothetical protein
VLTVGANAVEVEGRLAGGELECPGCGGVLARWGWARTRVLRGGGGLVRLRPRRARCGGCGGTHVLLPVFALLRRVDLAEVIGAALAAKAAGAGARSIAAAWGRPADTVRGVAAAVRLAGRAGTGVLHQAAGGGRGGSGPAGAGAVWVRGCGRCGGRGVGGGGLTLARHRRGAAVVAGLRGQRRPAAGPGLALEAVQHELPLMSGTGCLRVFAGSVMPRPVRKAALSRKMMTRSSGWSGRGRSGCSATC